MHAKLRNLTEKVVASLWFMPTLLVSLACAAAAATLLIDERAPTLGGLRPWLFGGTASAARDLLAAIARSLITVVALAFSVTIVAIQQASTQFSPRVIRNFMRDRGNQVVFGAYVATFVFALLILRQVRDEQDGGGGFVPGLAVTTALLLALICVGLLIYFIHHTAISLQVATIGDNIRRELREGIDRLYPDPLDVATQEEEPLVIPPPESAFRLVLSAPTAGFLRAVDAELFLGTLAEEVQLAEVALPVGDYVFEGNPLATLWSTRPLQRETFEGSLAAFTIDRERSLNQDILFGIRQLVDIALKALSPGINDPTTAEQCLSHLGDVVVQLADRQFPSPSRQTRDRTTILRLKQPGFGDIVAASFSQIRREAAGDVHVTAHLLDLMAQIAPRLTVPDRRIALRYEIREVLEALDTQAFTASDTASLRMRAFAALDACTDAQEGTSSAHA